MGKKEEDFKTSTEETEWQKIEHRKFLKLKKKSELKEKEPELMTDWQKIEHKKFLKLKKKSELKEKKET